jgi:hypothetical protein
MSVSDAVGRGLSAHWTLSQHASQICKQHNAKMVELSDQTCSERRNTNNAQRMKSSR